MSLRIIEITAPSDNLKRIQETAAEHHAIDSWYSAKNSDGRRTVRILTRITNQQELTDALQRLLSSEKNWRIIVQPADATIPEQNEEDDENHNGKANKIVRGTLTREELFNEIRKGAQTDFNFILLVILSAIVCGIGLIKSNVAVIIGAMVIAPLLGPNLALAFGAALGDRDLMLASIKANLAGLGLTLGMATLTGVIMHHVLHVQVTGTELLDRTNVGYDSLALALVSGAAAVLSMTTGLSSTLVGVMVAVALMPPAVTLGLMIGTQSWDYAYGAGLLLAANIVCVSVAAQIVFLVKGIKPRTWYQQKKSRQSVKNNIIFWVILLIGLLALIYLRQTA